MLKFFRKYNKIILVFGGTILMVLFLLPSGMSSLMGGGRGATVARMDGRKISFADIQHAGAELQLVTGLLRESSILLGIDPRDPAAWIARTHEAEMAGLVGGPQDGRAFLAEAATFLFDWNLLVVQARFGLNNAQQLLDRREEILRDLYASNQQLFNAATAGMTVEQAELALARAFGIYRMVQASNPSSILSRPEALRIAKNALDTVTVGTVIIPGSKIASELPEPDESRILEHFEKYRSVDRTSNPEGIGYLRPPAAVVEWLTIDRQGISDRLVLDPIEMNKYWRQNRARFPAEFAEARASVEIAYRAEQTQRALDRAAEVLRREIFRSTDGLPGNSRSKTLPENWAQRMPTLESLVTIVEQDLAKTFQLNDLPRSIVRASGRSAWLDSSALAQAPGIGQSSYAAGRDNQVPFANLVLAAQELGGDEAFGIQQGLIYGPLLNQSNGNAFYFRILETRREGPPESVDSVREQVVNNIKLLDALERLRTETEVYRERAVADGLSILAGSYGVSAQWGTQVTGNSVIDAGVSFADPRLNVPEFRTAVLDAARKLDPTQSTLAPDDPNRVIAMVLPTARGLVVAQIQRWRPATIEEYRDSSIRIRSLSVQRDPETNPLRNFEPETVAKRVGLKDIAGVIQRQLDEDEESNDPTANDAATND